MSILLHLGGAPSDEDCAQLGCTPAFAELNELEVETYRAAIIAVHGSPPEGYALRAHMNHHDFGGYQTLALVKTATQAGGRTDVTKDAQDYAERIEAGLATWRDAMFPAPVSYAQGSVATRNIDTAPDAIVRALIATRPSPDGTFATPALSLLHANLTKAWPMLARAARARLATGGRHVE